MVHLVDKYPDHLMAVGKLVPMDRAFAVKVKPWPAPLTSDAEAERAYRALLADPVFKSYAAVRYVWLNAAEYRETIAFADTILQAIESELLR